MVALFIATPAPLLPLVSRPGLSILGIGTAPLTLASDCVSRRKVSLAAEVLFEKPNVSLAGN